MHDRKLRVRTALGALAFLALPGIAAAQKIVCWKDKSGKVIGCGDKVPPEFLSNATKELDSRGVTRGQTESAEQANQRRLREQEAARLQAEEERRMVDQRRQDNALLATFSNEKEIDLKRDRDLQVLDLQLEQLTTAVKIANQHYTDVRGRFDMVTKGGRTPSPQLKTELERAASDKQRLEQNIEAKQKEKQDLRERFAGYKKRFNELRNGAPDAATARK
jgi:hypothetical protein